MVSFSSSESQVGAHINHYRRSLSSGQPTILSSFVDTYLQMKPLLHNLAAADDFDLPALRYAVTRLPPQTFKIKKIIITQSLDDFDKCSLAHDRKNIVTTQNRRRLMFYDDTNQVLGCLLNSDSDIDDLVNLLLIYLVEIRKIKRCLSSPEKLKPLAEIFPSELSELSDYLSVNNFNPQIQLFPPAEDIFVANCHRWWQQEAAQSLYLNLNRAPVYFVSSNSHSLINIVGGFINQKQNYLFDYLAHHRPDIYDQWFNSKVEHHRYQVNDFLYYLSAVFLKDNPEYLNAKKLYEKNLGVIKLNNLSYFPVDIQIIPVKSLAVSPALDPDLKITNRQKLSTSSAVIVNVEYPLGVAAKYLLNEIIHYFDTLKSVYIIGKAAILNGTVGDIQIPEIISDEISNNIFKFNNVFDDFFPFKTSVSQVLTHQKAACVYGTLLENQNQITNYQETGFNIIEMESSHYLTALVENYLQKSEPISHSVYYHLDNLPLDLGIINYASDNPLTQNLGHESLAFQSIETTYLPSLTVLQRIIDLETS
jgi:hypothetical protein